MRHNRKAWLVLPLVCFMTAGWDPPIARAAEEKTISWQDARDHVGEDVAVVGRVVRANRTGSGTVFLDFAQDYRGTLSVHIPAQAAARFSAPPQDFYRGKMVRVRGKIVLFKNDPSLTLTDPGHIAVLPDDTPLPGRAAATTSPAEEPWLDSEDERRLNIRPSEYLPTIAAAHVADFIDQEVIVVGRIVKGFRMPTGHVALDFDQPADKPLKLFIRAGYMDNFPEPPQTLYRDKLVRLRGSPYEFDGRPNISVSGPGQITILPDDVSPPAAPHIPVDLRPTMTTVPGEEITIASFNVENLFDSHDDPYRTDDAADAKPRPAMKSVADKIRKLDADVLALVEIENRGILDAFCKAFLSDMGYEPVLFEGNDRRGIDVALLSRLPVGPVTSHRHLRFEEGAGRLTRFRRDLLQVRIEPPGGTPFDVFVVHFKSKGGQEEGGADTRRAEAAQVRSVLDQMLERDPYTHFVVCGDFNDTIDSEPLKALIGTGPLALHDFIKDLPADERISYNKEPYLSMIDFILASPAMAERYLPRSYRIPQGSSETLGSDHNPVIAKFKTNQVGGRQQAEKRKD